MNNTASPGPLHIALYTRGLPFTGDTPTQQALGGSESAFIAVARQFAIAGHRVSAFCECVQEGAFDGVDYYHIERLDTWLAAHKPDIFICSRFFDVFAKPINARLKILWNHDYLGTESLQTLSQTMPQIDYMYCLSLFHQQHFANVFAPLRPVIKRTSNGVDFDLINPIRQATTKKYQIIYSSRPERGLWRALDIYEQLADRELVFLICTYRSFDNPETQAIEQACRVRSEALNAQGFTIRWASLPKHQLYAHMAESMAMLYPTHYPEVFCISAVEAQACGTVVLTSDDFALREVVIGKRFDIDDSAGFVATLRRVLTDPSYRQAWEQQGLDHVQQYSWHRVVEQFINDALAHWNPPTHNPADIASTTNAHRQRLMLTRLDRLVTPPSPSPPSPLPHQGRGGGVAFQRSDSPPHWWGRGWGWGELGHLPSRAPTTAPHPPTPSPLVGEGEKRRHALALLPTGGGGDGGGGGQQALTLPHLHPSSVLPTISCLTITLNRLVLLKEAIRCYCAQTYARRELVIVTDGTPIYQRAIADYIATLQRSDIKLVRLEQGSGMNLAQLRNIALEAASGELICQWDDDDLYHPQRLEIQAQHLFQERAQACFMSDQLHLFRPERSLAWIDWTQGDTISGHWCLIPGTLMMYTDARFRYLEHGPLTRKGEDSVLLETLYAVVPVTQLKGHAFLSIYVYHGANDFPEAHHRRFIGAPLATVAPHLDSLRAALQSYRLPMPCAFRLGDGSRLFVVNE